MTKKMFLGILVLGSTAGAVTLEEAYQAATQKTEAVPIAESQLRGADARVDAQVSTFLPQISAKGDYYYQNTKIGASTNNDQTDTRLALSQSLLAGGRDKANLDAAKSARKAQELNVSATKNNLYADVARSFYAVLSAMTEVQNIEKSIDIVKKRVGELQKFSRVGRSQKVDVLGATAQQSVLEAQRLAAIAERRIAKNNFANITGLDRNIELTDTTVLPEAPPPLQTYLESVENRPDVQSLKFLDESYASSVSAASAGHWPSLDLGANYYLSQSGAPSTSAAPDNWNASLTLTVPLFAGGLVRAQVRQAEEIKNQAELLLSQRRRDAEAEIRTAYNNLVSAIDQIKALEKAVADTEENYKEQDRDYRYKLTTNLDVLQSLNIYLDTKRSLDRTRYLALSSYAELKATTNQTGM